MKKRKGYRFITVDGLRYQYTVGRSTLVVYRYDGQKFVHSLETVACLPIEELRRGQKNGTDLGMIVPSMVADHIRVNCK